MRAPQRTKWGMAAAWLVAIACSNEQAAKPIEVVRPGPAAPEIGWRESPEVVERAPISLTASDGTGLRLVAVEAHAVIEDPLAFTELHLTFHNPESRRREGRFEIALPARAAISRFAMRVGDDFQEGEIVERRRAQQVYEDFLHRKQDPALLEKSAGNEFSARVFPIEPNATKEIIVSYSEELERHDDQYRIRLGGLPEVDRIAIDVRVGSNTATGQESTARARTSSGQLRLKAEDFTPVADVEVRLPWQQQVALRSGNLLVARVAPRLALPEAPIDGLTVLFDTSASRALGFAAQIERLGALVAELQRRAGKDFALRVIAFDQTAEQIYDGPASAFGLRDKGMLLARDALGASDLRQALDFAARNADGHARVLLIGDGVVTAGADDTTSLREAVAKLAAHGVKRLDVLAENGIQDLETLAALTHAGLPETGVLLDARAAVPQLVDKLWRGTQDRVEVKIAGATWIHPSVLESVQPGDERLVFAELPTAAPAQIELLGASAEAFESMEAPKPLIERAVARARIEALTAELRALPPDAADERARREREVVALSLEQRVVSDYTALLVLETAADYERFGIPQDALTSILRVGNDGIELFDRRSDQHKHGRNVLQVVRPEPEPPTAAAAQPEDVDEERSRAQSAMGSLMGGDTLDDAPLRGPTEGATAPSPGPWLGKARRDRGAIGTGRGGGGDGSSGLGSMMRPRSASRAASAPPPSPASPAKGEIEASAMMEHNAAKSAESAAPRASANGRAMPAAKKPSATRGAPAFDDLLALGYADGPRRQPRPLEIAADLPVEAKADVRVRGASGLPNAETEQAVRALRPRAKQCYQRSGASAGELRITLDLAISDKGRVTDAYVSGGSALDPALRACILTATRALLFPKPGGANASVDVGIVLSTQVAQTRTPVAAEPGAPSRPRPRAPLAIAKPTLDDAYAGALADVLAALQGGDQAGALARANDAHTKDPGDVIALVALGEALEAHKDFARAARVYGSIIDLFPSRPDLRRMASARLERLPEVGLALAVDSYRRALAQRPDHPSSHRGLAYALWKFGEHAEAFETVALALGHGFASDRFEGVDRILREDLALLGAAWLRVEPGAEARVRETLEVHGIELDRAPSLRFVLSWETDANDVDFHIHDGRGGHAYYMKPKLPSGGALYADITTGYGPECFAIAGKNRAYPYVLQAHYFARGPMGYGMGRLQAIEHDGQGSLAITEHPFVIMKDKAFVELARLERPPS